MGMNGIRRYALMTAGAWLVCPLPALCAERASEVGLSEVTVVDRLSLLKTSDLDLGQIIAGSTAGTVTLDPSTGARTRTGGVVLAGSDGTPAAFAGMGRFNQIVQLSIGANSILLQRAGGSQTMTMSNFIVSSAPPAQLTTSPRSFRIGNPTGLFEFKVGGRLNVGARQMPGTYTGTFTVRIQYL